MPQDAFTLRRLCHELNLIFAGGKINRIIEPNNDEVVFTIFNNNKTQKLVINVEPSNPRIGVCLTEQDSPITPPNFCMLLRKHLQGATIDSIEICKFDRIVKIECTHVAEFSTPVKKVLYAELMGRYSNLILTCDGKVLGGNRGINMFDDGVRPLIVGKDYEYPPMQDKKEPNDKALIDIFNKFKGENLSNYICQNVQGLATLTAKKLLEDFSIISHISESDLESDFASYSLEFFEYMNNVLYGYGKEYYVLVEEGQVKDILCLKPNDEREYLRFDKLYLAEEYYSSKRAEQKELKNKTERLTNLINTAIKKAKKRLSNVSAKEEESLNAETNKIKGELILSYIYKIPKNAEFVELENYYDEGKLLNVQLDSRLSPSKNAENYFKKYNKQKRSQDIILAQKEQAQNELKYLESLLSELELAEDLSDVKNVYQEAENVGIIKKTNNLKNKEESTPYREYMYNGYRVLVGKNNISNDKLVGKAQSENIWFHSKDYHSSHVILETETGELTDELIKFCAEVCGYYSKARNGGKTEIVYTKRKNLKKPRGAKIGFWTYKECNSIVVLPCKHLENLKN